jgi:ATP-dependent DNA ligase
MVASTVSVASHMRKSPYQTCIPTRVAHVPDRPEWLHEIKHDGYRLIVQRDGKKGRLFTRSGHDCSNRFPLNVEAALGNPWRAAGLPRAVSSG